VSGDDMFRRYWIGAAVLLGGVLTTLVVLVACSVQTGVNVIHEKADRLDHYCFEMRFETESVTLDQSADVVKDWARVSAAGWRSLRPCLLDGTRDEPACYPGELSCARAQAMFALSHFEYGFLQ
jgi:hypothetical protein